MRSAFRTAQMSGDSLDCIFDLLIDSIFHEAHINEFFDGAGQVARDDNDTIPDLCELDADEFPPYGRWSPPVHESAFSPV